MDDAQAEDGTGCSVKPSIPFSLLATLSRKKGRADEEWAKGFGPLGRVAHFLQFTRRPGMPRAELYSKQ
jgi:hypothetical protein